MDNVELRKFTNMVGEHFDLIKSYIDGYSKMFETQYYNSAVHQAALSAPAFFYPKLFE